MAENSGVGDRVIDQMDQEASYRERDLPVKIAESKDYGHGPIQVVQVLPESIVDLPPDEIKKTRLLIYCQPWNVTGKHELEKLEDDLQSLARGTQGDKPVRVMGIAYTGARDTNSSRFIDPSAEKLPEGVAVTQLQLDKAQDLVNSIKDMGLIEGKNAEIIGFSAGGPIAQLAEGLGLPVDTVGLFNASSLDNKGYGRTAARVVLEGLTNFLLRHPKERFDLEQLEKDQAAGHEGSYRFAQKVTRPLKDLLGRSLSENIAVGRSRTHQLIGASPEKNIVGQTKWDLVYPRRRIRKVLSSVGDSNVTYVSLDGWHGHHMGSTPARRRERLGEIGKVMKEARKNR